ncbi:MAG: glucose-6-phosphate isomerase, partial [Armatimonadetes bacterium]|nr:glucose-6-phosphate isomerase [Candidatus Hippobium faecium]
SLDITNLGNKLGIDEICQRQNIVDMYDGLFRSGKCLGSDFTGWQTPETILTDEESKRIKDCAERLKKETDYLLVIGIGGSYLGARAVIEALSPEPEKVIFAGQNISAAYMTNLKNKLKGKKVAINIISKSGTTTEPALALRIFMELVQGCEKTLLVATTDAKKGSLLKLAEKLGVEKFVVPDNIGGRYSVLSAVGILPIAYAGVDVDALAKGAADCAELCKNTSLKENPAYMYAVIRNILSYKGYDIEILSSFEPNFLYMAEWWKQLFGESEGKQGMGLFPASCSFSTDLHSLGQFIQDGKRCVFETFVTVEEGEPSLIVPKWDEDSDGMNYLAGKEVSFVNKMAYEATAKAHFEGNVPNITIKLKEMNAYTLGALIYFFEIACAITCLIRGINPFDQPGVEAYKKHMFKLLGKPGYEKEEVETENRNIIEF